MPILEQPTAVKWEKRTLSRWGVNYAAPAAWRINPPPQNGDGSSYIDGDTTFTVSGSMMGILMDVRNPEDAIEEVKRTLGTDTITDRTTLPSDRSIVVLCVEGQNRYGYVILFDGVQISLSARTASLSAKAAAKPILDQLLGTVVWDPKAFHDAPPRFSSAHPPQLPGTPIAVPPKPTLKVVLDPWNYVWAQATREGDSIIIAFTNISPFPVLSTNVMVHYEYWANGMLIHGSEGAGTGGLAPGQTTTRRYLVKPDTLIRITQVEVYETLISP